MVKNFFSQPSDGVIGSLKPEDEAFSWANRQDNGLVRYPPMYSGTSTRGDSQTGARSRIQDIFGIRVGNRIARARYKISVCVTAYPAPWPSG